MDQLERNVRSNFGRNLVVDYHFSIWTVREAFKSTMLKAGSETRTLAAALWAEHSASTLYGIMKYNEVDKESEALLTTPHFSGKKFAHWIDGISGSTSSAS